MYKKNITLYARLLAGQASGELIFSLTRGSLLLMVFLVENKNKLTFFPKIIRVIDIFQE
jgi:hypothetical protein